MLGKWLEEYKRLSEQMQFFSQLTAFLISIFSFFSFCELVRNAYLYPSFRDSDLIATLIFSLIFQAVISTIFAARFISCFFKTNKAFWLSQTLWLLGIAVFILYWLVSRPSSEPSFDFGEPFWWIFIYASPLFRFLGFWYLMFSPFWKVITFVGALTKPR